MSRKEDVLLEERIEKIRRKNEEIKRRHLEVEADKQHAAKLNALVQPRAPTEDWTTGWSSPAAKSKQHEREVQETRQSAPQGPQTPKTGRRREPNAVDSQRFAKQNGKCYNFTEGNGPPPDPVYNFLADSEREPDGEWPARRGPRQGAGRGRQRGRDRAQPHKDTKHNNHPAEYEAWRAERNRIDQDRINRQKTAEGLWRREWDNEKVTQDFEEDQAYRGPVSRPPQSRIGSGRFGGAPTEHLHNGSGDAARVLIRGGRRLQSGAPPSELAGTTRGDRGVEQQGDTLRVHVPGAESSHQAGDVELARTSARTPPLGKRNICKVDGTLTISIANDTSSSTNVPLQRVRVKPPTVVGSGRVGPRQKARVSYSSQSDEEQLSPQRLTRTVDNTPPSPSRNVGQTVKFNPASLRPPLPPVSAQNGSVPRKKRDDSTGNRQSRKRNMRGDYSKREERRTDSTGSSRGNDSEGAGEESWEDVTTSGTESAYETSEEKEGKTASKNQMNVGRTSEYRNSATSGTVYVEGKEMALNDQSYSDENTDELQVSQSSYNDYESSELSDNAHSKSISHHEE